MTETLSEETKTIATILRHKELVREYLYEALQKLEVRAIEHDSSKLTLDELIGFVAINYIAREYPYGSEEYKKSLQDYKPIIDLHFSRNRHHPEHFQNGVGGMGLVDIIEMVCDWKAASVTYGNTTLLDSVQIQIERFKLTKEQVYLIELIIKEIEKES